MQMQQPNKVDRYTPSSQNMKELNAIDNNDESEIGRDFIEMTVKLDTTMKKYEQDGGDNKFIKNVT